MGAAKCGTTTLHGYLNSMPDICMSRPKEPFFFEAEFENGLEFYREKYFAHWKGESIIGDARNMNLYLPYVPQRIYQVNPNAKLLLIIRNPIERVFSTWRHECYHQNLTLSFEKFIENGNREIKKDIRMEINNGIVEYTKRVLSPLPQQKLQSWLVRPGYGVLP